MNAETLERLLMDRALDGLSPDVEGLLAAYLERDVEAAARGREFSTAAATARQVLASGTGVSLPPFPAARIRKLEQSRRQLRWVRNIAGVAASLLIGIGLGAAFSGQRALVPGGADTRLIVSDGVIQTVARAEPSADGFWSAQRLYEQRRATKPAASVRLIWDSPVSKPRLGGKT